MEMDGSHRTLQKSMAARLPFVPTNACVRSLANRDGGIRIGKIRVLSFDGTSAKATNNHHIPPHVIVSIRSLLLMM